MPTAQPIRSTAGRGVIGSAEGQARSPLVSVRRPAFRPFQRWARASGQVWEVAGRLARPCRGRALSRSVARSGFTERVAMPIAREAPAPLARRAVHERLPGQGAGSGRLRRGALPDPASRQPGRAGLLDRGCKKKKKSARRACPLGAQTRNRRCSTWRPSTAGIPWRQVTDETLILMRHAKSRAGTTRRGRYRPPLNKRGREDAGKSAAGSGNAARRPTRRSSRPRNGHARAGPGSPPSLGPAR